MAQEEKSIKLGLEEKIDYSKNIIKEAIERFDHERIAIAITGGKDSTALLWLFKNVCHELSTPIPECVFIDEGDVFTEIYNFVKKLKNEWNLDITVAKNTDVSSKAKRIGDIIKVKDLNKRNRQELMDINFDGDDFPFEPESILSRFFCKFSQGLYSQRFSLSLIKQQSFQVSLP